MQTHLNGMPWKSISISLPRVYLMSNRIIWSTEIILAWTPGTYICPEWMWKAPLMSILVICAITSYDELSADAIIVKMGCLINELDIGPRRVWRTKSSRMVTEIGYVPFYVKISQCSPLYWFHQSVISSIIAESCNWSKNLVGGILKQWLGVWYSSGHTLQFRRLYYGMGWVCCQHITTRIPEIPTMLKNNNNLI